MKIIFLGTNGWYDTKTGNTPCVLIDTKDFYLVLDSGNGIYKLDRYIKEKKPIHLFISHLHLDHIEGLHILPKFKFQNQMTIFVFLGMKNYLLKFANFPFTLPFEKQKFSIVVKELSEGKHSLPYNLQVLPLEHQAPTMGLRFELEKKIIAYCSDTAVCENGKILAKKVDWLIHECSWIKLKEIKWGHSFPWEVAKLAKEAAVKNLFLTHFAADEFTSFSLRKKAEEEAKKIFPRTKVAKDGLVIKI